jgi:ParB-like nuclease domain
MENQPEEQNMPEGKYDWLIKKTPRSVDALRLWPENPRLNPEDKHLTTRDFAEDFTEEDADKADFYELVTSIANDGFVPADPVVVWRNEDNDKFYVAEGNRRVLALKLLRDPDKAPKDIRKFIQRASDRMNLATIEKIPVNVAPSFEDAEWYINQRNSTSSLQRKWSRVQQQRWIATLYDKHNGDLEKILSITKLSKSELEGIIRVLKIKDFVKEELVKSKLTDEEFDNADSYRFPITILERLFGFIDVRDKWGIEFDGIEVNIRSNKVSFYNLFAELIKRIVNKSDNRINTRINKEDLPEIFASLPEVSFETDVVEEQQSGESSAATDAEEAATTKTNDSSGSGASADGSSEPAPPHTPTITHLKGNPNRGRIVLPIYHLTTSSYRLAGIFDELKRIPTHYYPNHVAASIRVFLDLAVLSYIDKENLSADISRQYQCELKEVQLKRRLEYIKANKAQGKVQTILSRLIDPNQQFSLDVLNGFMHSQDAHYNSRDFLNRFWDFLFPLFEFLLDITETV